MKKGVVVSVLGLVLGNLGSITALLIGIVISHTRGTGAFDGYHKYDERNGRCGDEC